MRLVLHFLSVSSLLLLSFGAVAQLETASRLAAVQPDQAVSTSLQPQGTLGEAASQSSVLVVMPLQAAEAIEAAREKSTLDAVAHQKPVIISGSVLNEHNEPLAGVTITLKSTAALAVSDAEGKYSLKAIPGTNTLLYSYGGYQDKELVASNFLPVTVSLQPLSDNQAKARGKRGK